ncbi:Ankyrin-3 [Apiospora saccharicola]|uniref:Ankyrin-3 n=1 Tax=Apiospora saccharicola TaxID=335842 RepID=A0ABR1ULZ5_9PEZI
MATGIEIVGAVAACIEVIRFSKSIVSFVSDITQESSEIPNTLINFRFTIEGVGNVFENIQDAIKEQGLSESDNCVKVVSDNGRHCALLLAKLEDQLPKIPATKTTQKVWLALKQKINEKVIQDQVGRLKLCMQITQVALWAIESRHMSRQDAKIEEIQELLSELAAAPAYSPSSSNDRDYNQIRTNIDKIREVATRESSVYNLDMDSVSDRRAAMPVSPSGLDTLPSALRTLLETERPTTPPRNDPVDTLEGRGMFLRAANEESQRVLPREEVMKREERRADLLLKCATIRHHERALEILIRLWESESLQDDASISPKRLGQLGSKAAKILLNSQRLGHFTDQEQAVDRERASSVLNGSLDVLMKKIGTLQPYPYKTLLEVGELCIHLLKETGKATYVGQTGNALRRRIGDQHAIPSDWPHSFEASRSQALAWCEPTSLKRLHERWPDTATVADRPDLLSLNFDVRSAGFRFDEAVGGISPLHLAVIYEEKEILAEMLGEVEDINVGSSTPLMEAAMNGNEDIASMLLKHDASVERVDAKKRTALHYAQIGKGSNVATLSKSFLDAPQGRLLLEKEDVQGKTALYLACKKGNSDTVELLVNEHKARVNVVDVYDQTALHATVEATDRPEERLKVARILLEAKADPNKSDYGDRTPLSIACSHGNCDLVRHLLEYGANPNKKGPEGQTPLIMATKFKHVDVVLALMARGAQPNIKDDRKQSALTYAERTKTTSDIYNILCGRATSHRRQMSIASERSATSRRTDTTSTRSVAHRSFDFASEGSSSISRRSSNQ